MKSGALVSPPNLYPPWYSHYARQLLHRAQTIPDSAYCDDFGAISVTEQSSAAPISGKWRVTDRIGFVLHFDAERTGVRTVAEVKKQGRGLAPTETEVNIQGVDWDLVHQTLSSNHSAKMFDVCERRLQILDSPHVRFLCGHGSVNITLIPPTRPKFIHYYQKASKQPAWQAFMKGNFPFSFPFEHLLTSKLLLFHRQFQSPCFAQCCYLTVLFSYQLDFRSVLQAQFTLLL